jgi:hypothetical protein
MAIYRLKIVGVHYAVNPDSFASAEETELMHQRTAERLRELDEKRPRVALVPEPTNPVDPRAVMARVMGKRIGYVDKTQLDIVHSLLQSNGGKSLIASIDEVEARKHGWLFIALEAGEEVAVEALPKAEDAWKEWTCSIPTIAPDEAHFAREEAEAVLDEVLSKYPTMLVPSRGASPEIDIDLLEEYIRLWLRSSLHDLSNEARLTREHYIMRLKEMMSRNATPFTERVRRNAVPLPEPLSRIRALVSELEKQRTAICGQKRSNLRVAKWWKELLASKEMELLWKTWLARNGEDMEKGLNELVTPLRALPYDLYAYIDDRKLFFSRLHYSQVPRAQYWQIVSLMLLRERLKKELKEGGDETYHPWGNEPFPQMEDGGYNGSLPPSEGRWGRETRPQVEEEAMFLVTIPKELQTTEAKKLLAKLQKKGLLDADLQPVGLSAAKKGVLAWELCDHLGIKTCWKTMGILWKCKGETIRKARDKGIMTDAVIEFTKKIKAIIY